MNGKDMLSLHPVTTLNRRALLRLGLIAAGTGAVLTRTSVSAAQSEATPTAAATPQVSPEVLAVYKQSGITAEGWPVDIVIAAPEYLRAAGRTKEFEAIRIEHALVVLVTRHHGGALVADQDAFAISAKIDGSGPISATDRHTLADYDTSREDAYFFRDIDPIVLSENHLIEIILPAKPDGTPVSFMWISPLTLPGSSGTPTATTPEATSESMIDTMETAIPSSDIDVC